MAKHADGEECQKHQHLRGRRGEIGGRDKEGVARQVGSSDTVMMGGWGRKGEP